MTNIGRYEPGKSLGAGGFGSVYRAWDPVMQRHVAIKLLTSTGDPALLLRFRSEAGMTGNLKHKNIVTVYDYGEHEGQPYLVMELLEGRSLKDVIEHGLNLSLLEKIGILRQVAEALQYAHACGVIHRDIKPANIMLLQDGSVKILDFGIARLVEAATRHTMAGMIIGTVDYMAPEQIQGRDATVLTDIFSYAVTGYELLSGIHPFRVSNAGATMFAITNLEPKPLYGMVPDCPAALETLIATAIAKFPANRQQNFREILFDLAPVESDVRRREADALAREVERLLGAGDLDAAGVAVVRVLELDPTHERARDLRKSIQRAREARAAGIEIREALRSATKSLEEGRFELGIARLEAALNIPGAESAGELRSEVERRLSAARQAWEEARAAERREAERRAEAERLQRRQASERAERLLAQEREAAKQRRAAEEREVLEVPTREMMQVPFGQPALPAATHEGQDIASRPGPGSEETGPRRRIYIGVAASAAVIAGLTIFAIRREPQNADRVLPPPQVRPSEASPAAPAPTSSHKETAEPKRHLEAPGKPASASTPIKRDRQPPPVETPAAVTPSPPRPDPAEQAWTAVADSRDSRALAGYIGQYPNSPHRAAAEQRIEQLEWESIDHKNAATLEGYARKYPNSPFASEAHNEANRVSATGQAAMDQRAILGTLASFSRAVDQKDETQLRAAWPGIPKSKLEEWESAFKSTRSLRIELRPNSAAEVSGAVATLACHSVLEKVFDGAAQVYTTEGTMRFTFIRQGDGWVIQSMR